MDATGRGALSVSVFLGDIVCIYMLWCGRVYVYMYVYLRPHTHTNHYGCCVGHTGIYYTDPLLWDPLSGTCQLSEAILGRVRRKTRGKSDNDSRRMMCDVVYTGGWHRHLCVCMRVLY